VNKYNALIDKLLPAIKNQDTESVQKLVTGVHFTAGGHNCHRMYWENLAPVNNGGGVLPAENAPLRQSIVKHWGSVENFQKDFSSQTGAIKGSGWGWLGLNPETKALSIEQTLNQDSIVTNGLVPLLTVDVWEHAYYLQYKNLRPDYLKKIWDVVNWRCVEKRYNDVVLDNKK
jgi:Fe-Mn family superoxide dismutase